VYAAGTVRWDATDVCHSGQYVRLVIKRRRCYMKTIIVYLEIAEGSTEQDVFQSLTALDCVSDFEITDSIGEEE
jgi:uncharacterized protein with ACT and thioredoxin-like domain